MAGVKFDITGDNKNVLMAFQQVQQGVKEIENTTKQAGGGIESMFSQMKSSFMSGITQMTGSIMGLNAMMASGNFIKTMYDDMGKFSLAMKEVSTISADVANDLDGFKKKVVELCTQIAIAPEEAAKALYQIESAGHHGEDGLKVLEQSAKGAIGGVTETAVAADAITSILNSYRMSAEEAAHVNDLLFTTVRLGKTTYGELGATIAQVTPIASTYGVKIEEVMAALATLTKTGTKTSVAVRQVRDAIVAATNSLGDGAFKSRSFLEAMDEIAQKAAGSETALKQDLNKLQAMNAVLGLTGENASVAADDMRQMMDSAGAAEDAYEKMNDTAASATEKLKNNLFAAFMGIGDSLKGMTHSIAETLNAGFDSGVIQGAVTALEAFIAAYAIYKGLLISTSALQRASTAGLYEAEMAQLSTILPAKEAEAQTDLEIAVAEGRLTQEKADLILAMRGEAQARLQELHAQAAQAIAAHNEATTTAANCALKLESAEAEVAACEAKYAAAVQSGNATAIETATTELNTAISTQNAAAKELQIARETAKTTAIQADNAATALNSAEQVVNTTQTGANTMATGLLTSAKMALKSAIDAVNASFRESPLFWIAATIAAVVYAVYSLVTAETAHEKAVRVANEAMDEQDKKLKERKDEINELIRTIRDKTASDLQQVKAYNRLKQIAPTITDQYTQQELATIQSAESQKELNEELDNLDVEDAKQHIEDLKNKIAEYKNEIEKANKPENINTGTVGWVGYLQGQLDEAQVQLSNYQSRLYEIERTQQQAAKNAIPLEIRIKEAEENQTTYQNINDFYQEAADLASDWQYANDTINFATGETRLDNFIAKCEDEIYNLGVEIETNPNYEIRTRLELKQEEITKILNYIISMKNSILSKGLTQIPFGFYMDWDAIMKQLDGVQKVLDEYNKQAGDQMNQTFQSAVATAKARTKEAKANLDIVLANPKSTVAQVTAAKNEYAEKQQAEKDLIGDIEKEKQARQKAERQRQQSANRARTEAQRQQRQQHEDAERQRREQEKADREAQRQLDEEFRTQQRMLRLQDLQNKQRRDLSRETVDMIIASQQEIINATAEGSKRQVMQIELDYDKESEAIRRKGEDLVEAKINVQKQIFEQQHPEKDHVLFDVEAAKKEIWEMQQLEAMQREFESKEENKGKVFNKEEAKKTLKYDPSYSLLTAEEEAYLKERERSNEVQRRMKLQKAFADYETEGQERDRERLELEEDIAQMKQLQYDLQDKLATERASMDADAIASAEAELKMWDDRIRLAENLRNVIELTDEQNARLDWLQNYGTYLEKKQGVKEKYENEINNATAQYGADSWAVKNLQSKLDAELSQLDFDRLKEKINWDAVFGSLDQLTKKELKNLKAQLQEFAKDVDPEKDLENYKTLMESIRNIDKALVGKGKLFGGIKDAIKELDEATSAVTDKEAELALMRQNGLENTDEYIRKEDELAKLRQVQQEKRENVSLVKDKNLEGLKTLQSAVDNFSGGLLQNAGALTENIGKLLSGGDPEKMKNSEKMGAIVGFFAGLTEAIAEKGLKGFVDDAFQDIGNALGSIFDTIGGIFGIDGMGGIFGDSDKGLQAAIESLERSNKDLENSIEKLTTVMQEGNMEDAKETYEKAKSAWESEEQNYQTQLARMAKNFSRGFIGIGSKGSVNRYINEALGTDDWEAITKLLGKNVSNAKDLWKLSSKEMADIATWLPAVYSKIKEGSEKGKSSVSDVLDEYSQLYEKMEELERSYYEKLTGTTFDSVLDEFKSLMMDMDSTAENFAENFENYLKNAIFESLILNKYKQQLNEWYKAFGLANEDGKITPQEQAQLRKQYDEIVEQAIQDRNNLYETMDWSKSGSKDQQTSAGGWSAMGQEQADELNGRFTALQMAGERISDGVLSMVETLNSMSVNSSDRSIILTEIRNLMITNNSYLEDINEYAKKVYLDFGKKLDKLVLNTN